MSRLTVFRWDLDKTYLVSHFESLRQIVRIPFQKASDKIAVPGVVALIGGLRETALRRGRKSRVYFLSASPPQIGGAIRDKLRMDGIVYDGITFKDQVRNLIRGRFDAVLEQVGYKLEQLLRGARDLPAGTRELLFGDDWESDPFVYSLYADILEGRIGRDRAVALLECADVNRACIARIAGLIDEDRPALRVAGVFILRQRPAAPSDLDGFGVRTMWFDNYFECALGLYANGHLDSREVLDVANSVGMTSGDVAASFDAVCARGAVAREWLSPVRRELVVCGLMDRVAGGRWLGRLAALVQRLLGRPPARLRLPPAMPNYDHLVTRWSYRGRKGAMKEVLDEQERQADVDDGEEPGGCADDGGERG